MAEMVSKKSRYELAEYLSSFVLREIDLECEAVDIAWDRDHDPKCSGARRTRARQYLHALDYTKAADVRKFLALCENLLNRADVPANFAQEFPKWLRRDGFDFVDGRCVAISGLGLLTNVRAIATEFDASHMHEQIRRITSAVEDDPALAIGSAKELVETCCKTILSARNNPAKGTEDVLELVKRVRAELKLLPEDVPQSAKGAETIKRVLSNLASVAQGLAELRSMYGTGHGRDGKARGLKPRHARLAVSAAAALAVFLFETHNESSTRGSSE